MISLQGMAGFHINVWKLFGCNNLKLGIRKLAYLKVDIGKILGKFPWMRKIPLQGNGMAAIPKILGVKLK